MARSDYDPNNVGNVVIIQSPTYDRTNPSPFTIVNTKANNGKNNANNLTMKLSFEDQPSIVILEKNTKTKVETVFMGRGRCRI